MTRTTIAVVTTNFVYSSFIILLFARASVVSHLGTSRVKYEIHLQRGTTVSNFHIVNWESNYTQTRGIALGGPGFRAGESALSDVPKSGHQAGRVCY